MRFGSVFLMLAAAAPFPAPAQSSYVALSPTLARWKQEIEQKDGGKVVLARIYTDPLRNEMQLPEDTEERPVLRRYFLQEGFRGQLSGAHALMLNYEGAEGRLHFVLLNMALADQWEGEEEAVLAEEFGHLWLNALGYALPAYEPGERACIGVSAGDAVHHVLVRRELEGRGLAHRAYWIRNLEEALQKVQAGAGQPAGLTPCQKLARLALWLDVRLGVSPEEWPDFTKFQDAMARNTPEIQPYLGEIETRLRALQAAGSRPPAALYRETLDFTLKTFAQLYAGSH